MVYRILEASLIEKLEENVNEALADGVRLVGGVAMKPGGESFPTIYMQAVIYDE